MGYLSRNLIPTSHHDQAQREGVFNKRRDLVHPLLVPGVVFRAGDHHDHGVLQNLPRRQTALVHSVRGQERAGEAAFPIRDVLCEEG